jgi:hypothetical protein
MKFLLEDLTQKQKDQVDSWVNRSYRRPEHTEVLGKESRIAVPYDDSYDPKITSDSNIGNKDRHTQTVLRHIAHQGYRTDDYHSGLAYHPDTPNRKVRIGSLMTGEKDVDTGFKNAKGKSMKMSQVYAADPQRAMAGKQKMIVYSSRPYDVGGMATDRSWSSCMNMNDGHNKHFLQNDIQHGTISAYLTHPGDTGDKDEEIHKPIGRISIKKFENSNGHAIWRPEESSYGSIPPGFHKQVKEFAEKNFPAKNGIYLKEPTLYNDDGKNIIIPKGFDSDENHQKLHNHLEKVVKNMLDARQAYIDRHIDKYGEMPGHDIHNVDDAIHNFTKMIPKHHTRDVLLQSMVDNVGEDHHDYDDLNSHYANGSDDVVKHVHHYAAENLHKFAGHKDFDDMGPAKSMEWMKKLHDSSENYSGENYANDADSALKTAHEHLLDHVIKTTRKEKTPEWNAAKTALIHHVTDSAKNNSDYYHDFMDKHALVPETTDPRLHEHLMNNDNEKEYALNHKYILEHMGQHADFKSANNFIHHTPDVEQEDHLKPYIVGLNQNKDGEKIQHKLINQMHYTGGKDEDGNDHWYDDSRHAMFTELAAGTKHKSVFDRLKSRSSYDLDHPEIHEAIASNPHFKIPK